ncbi:MAG: 6-phosphogluconolactonase [Chitinophagaceae bacterium]|nr:MAG: 6-phosphogluconolactonase [Chitinophagaceae bacterium]
MLMIKVFSTTEELCNDAMEQFIGLSVQHIASKGSFVVALSGGRTPNQLYDLMAKKENAEKIDWKNCFFFWGDERYVAHDNKENNSFQAKQHLLDLVPVPEGNIFRIPVNGDHEADAKIYEQTIRSFFKGDAPVFDLLFLGMGDEGHTASIFPGSSLLQEKDALVKDVYVEVKQMQRISFTPKLINAASHIIFMITGAEKAAALREVLEGNKTPEEYPARVVQPTSGGLSWLLDQGAASLLSSLPSA